MAGMLVEVARRELGMRERGNTNRGSQIDKYFSAAGIEPGQPWCACFVAWCMARLGDALGRRLAWRYSAWCPDLALWALELGVAVKGRAEPGRVMLQYHGDLGRYAHAGVVEKVRGTRVTCIEGNTNNDGSRNGFGVLRHVRDLGGRYLYLDVMAANRPPTPASLDLEGRLHPGWLRADTTLYVAARPVAEALHLPLDFGDGLVLVDGTPVETVNVLGSGHVPARALVEAAGRRLLWDPTRLLATVR